MKSSIHLSPLTFQFTVNEPTDDTNIHGFLLVNKMKLTDAFIPRCRETRRKKKESKAVFLSNGKVVVSLQRDKHIYKLV